MKTERRHELQTNTLAISLAEGIEKVRPYTNHILLAIGAVIVLLLALIFFRSQAHAKQAKAWEAYFVATTPSATSSKNEQDMLRDVIKDFSDTPMSDWAKLTIGDDALNNASQLISANKSDARKNINVAIAEYKPLGESSDVPQVRNLANYNLGLCHEMLGDVDKAIESYRKVNGTMAKLAKDRADALEKNTEVREFYAWFATVEPATQAITGGSQPGRMPPFKVDEPDKVAPFSDAPGGKEDTSENSPINLFPDNLEGNKTENTGEVTLPGLGIDSPKTPTTPVTPEGTSAPETPTTPEAGDAPTEKPAEPAAPAEAPAEDAKPAEESKPAEAAPAAEEATPSAPAKSE